MGNLAPEAQLAARSSGDLGSVKLCNKCIEKPYGKTVSKCTAVFQSQNEAIKYVENTM
jgi:hypothetical protein